MDSFWEDVIFVIKNVKNLTIVKFIYPNDTIYYGYEDLP